MRILYDHQAFAMQKYGGVSRCFVELCKNMPTNVDTKISLCKSDNAYIKEIVEVRPLETFFHRFLNKHDFRGKWRIKSLLDWYWDGNTKMTIDLLKKGDYDIFHPTFFSDYFIPHLNGKPFVLTIHDMTAELYPQFFVPNDFQIIMKRKLAPLANAIITVSENTKKDVIQILKVPEEKVHVVHHGSTFVRPKECQPIYSFPYILYVGGRWSYKNFVPFVNSIVPVLNKRKEMKVICTGAPFSIDEKNLFEQVGMSNRFIHYWAETDSVLYALYHYASCFVYPSEYEGFGLPILEAYQADCPVILNQASCFPEIAGDAAIFFHIGNKESDLAEQIETVLNMNLSEREKLLANQRKRLATFSWRKSAEQLAKIYFKVYEQMH